MATAQQNRTETAPTRQHLTIKGSTEIVHEFFSFSVQSILYQRGIYPAEDFKPVRKYGLQMLTTTDEGLSDYLSRAMQQVEIWLLQGKITRLVVAIVEKESQETRERWQFNVDVIGKGEDDGEEKENVGKGNKDEQSASKSKPAKTDAQVKQEISSIIRQITASCTFLPVLEEPCAFQILAYTSNTSDTEVPSEWIDSDARLISEGEAEQVRLRSFSTAVHHVEAMVAYKRENEDE